MNKSNIQKKINFISLKAYTSFIFQTFFKRPFGYILALLYIAYIIIIFLIVPSVQKMDPLFIWNIGGFNVALFNLLFISASAASLAVCVFKTGKDDGSDLLLSSKPLTKTSTVLIKVFAYLIIMLAICLIILFITSLILPIFGEYNEITNPTGIELSKYKSLLLSMLFGNLLNYLLFGAIAVLITVFGSQVLTMIITIGTAFLLCLLNFLLPLTVQSTTKVLKNTYNSSILSYSVPTLSQYNTDDSNFKTFATIQAYTTDNGESTVFDTYKYWTEAKKISKSDYINYVDIGKQLSLLFSSFGMNDSKLIEASKLPIGANSNYRYTVLENTNVKNSIDQKHLNNIPFSYYTITQDRGKTFPKVYILGGTLNLETSNWYLWSKLFNLNFNSITFVSSNQTESIPSLIPENYLTQLNSKAWTKLSDLKTTKNQIDYIFNNSSKTFTSLYDKILLKYIEEAKKPKDVKPFSHIAYSIILSDNSNIFFPENKFNNLSLYEKYVIISKIELLLLMKSTQLQINSINNFCKENMLNDSFPFTSKTINAWYKTSALEKTSLFYWNQKFAESLIKNGIFLFQTDSGTDYNSKFLISSMNYAETYSNLYQYSISDFYSIWLIFGIWGAISVTLFSTSIIVYKKIDLK